MTRSYEANGVGVGSQETIIDPIIAIKPSAPQKIPQLVQDVQSRFETFANGSLDTRLELLEAARSLVHALETPQETLIQQAWVQPTAFAAIETCIDLGVFKVLAWSDEPKTVEELALKTGAAPDLLSRLLKHLAAVDVVVETGLDQYSRNGLTTTLSIKRYSDAWPAISGCSASAVSAMPIWFKENGYNSPIDGNNSPFQTGFRTECLFFDFLRGKNPDYPDLGSQFNNLMSAYHQGRASWMDPNTYPVQEKLIDGASTKENHVLIVDVGGNKGHDLEEFRLKWPNAPGRLILQDLPQILEDIKSLDSAIEPMAHDFYTEQPVKGARAYFLHSVLHDWSDETCQLILRRLVDAMTPGYSKLLINENVVPDIGAHCQATSLDLIMLADLGARERTEKQWREVIAPTGLVISKIWTPVNSAESLIECELKEIG
ncbi:hypothetical protein N7493_011442 [Penicillium malachiteum]|uniref:O-methyltransferase domain-containing protein n=1 Tax=Penicillium malachiteum TaxID=1324776 RepID=A0AAD6HCF5_9EURO|nr:hypothetical protein N7493_011442 [Penicillium malachiteum]